MSIALAAVTLVASLVAALGGVAPTAAAGDATRTGIAGTTTRLIDAPCPGCFASLPSSDAPAPLLVLLHGDFESASAIYAKWHTWAEPRGIAVLAPACPASEGCKRSWWRWNGDSTWLVHQIDAIAVRHALDRERLWLVGWSGGASYVGWRTQEFERTFAAIVIHGGGMAPERSDCGSASASVYFLVGDRNPLHRLAVDLRRHYDACGQEVQWSLLAGATHGGEWEALNDTRGRAILDWLETKRRPSSANALARATAMDPGSEIHTDPTVGTASTQSPPPVASDPAVTSAGEPAPLQASASLPGFRCTRETGVLAGALGSTGVLAWLLAISRKRIP